MKKRKITALILCVLVFFGGCSASDTTDVKSPFAPDEANRLTIYTSHKEEVYKPIIKEFEERTGIWVKVISGGTNELLQRIDEEQSAPNADVMFGGGVENLEAYRHCFAPYSCAHTDKIDPVFCSEDGIWTPFSALPVVLIYNTKLVSPEQLTRWSDLFSPEFRGKIAFCDPSISGSSFTGLVTKLYSLGENNDETLLKFADILDGRQLESSGSVLASVSDGTDFIGITLEETALKYIAAGSDIQMVYPKDGTSFVPDGSAIIKNCAHMNNARLFLDFTASREVQSLLTNSLYRRSVRTDIEPLPALLPLENIPMTKYDVSWASENRDSVLMTWAFFLGGGEEQ